MTMSEEDEIVIEDQMPEDSILLSVKNIVGVDASNTAFDNQLLAYINMVLTLLYQIGVSENKNPIKSSNETWNLVTTNEDLWFVRTYVGLKVRILFDPPVGVANDALSKQIDELEWRLKVGAELSEEVEEDA